MFEIYKSKIEFMVSKILIGSGILMIVVGIAPIVWEIYRMTHEAAGIGAIGGSLLILVFSLIVGVILILIGAIKLYKDAKTLK
jgi:hypothetical protein